MEDFAGPCGVIPVVLEKLGKSYRPGILNPEIGEQIRHAGLVGTQPGEHGRTRRVADSLLAIGIMEYDPARCDGIHIRGDGIRIRIATQSRSQVIEQDKQYVHFLLLMRLLDFFVRRLEQSRYQHDTETCDYMFSIHFQTIGFNHLQRKFSRPCHSLPVLDVRAGTRLHNRAC